MGLIIVGVIGVVALVGGVVLASFVVRGIERRGKAAAMVGGFAFALIAALVDLVLLAVYGTGPVLIAGMAVALLAVALLFLLVGREGKWRWTRMLALFGVAVMCMLLTFVGGMVLGDRIASARAAQIAQAQGFEVLLPGWLPAMHDVEGLINVPPGNATISLTWVEEVSEPDAGVWLGHNGLDVCERKTGTGLSLTQLESKLPTDATRTQITIRGQPALLVEYKDEQASILPSGEVRALFSETGGVTVNMTGLSKEQLIKVAESLTTQ